MSNSWCAFAQRSRPARVRRPLRALRASRRVMGSDVRAVSEAVLRDTYEVDDRELVRFAAPGELAMAFTGWTLLHAVEIAADAGDPDPGRATSVVVARRPAGGTLLA